MKKFLCILITILLAAQALLFVLPASAEGTEAQKIAFTHEVSGINGDAKAFDGDHSTYASSFAGGSLTIKAEENIGFLYIEFNHAPGEWTLLSGMKSAKCGADGFIHEFVDVQGLLGDCKTVSLSFPGVVELTDVYVYGKGEVPANVQRWKPACDRADLLLLSAHSDDDQLYFAGLIPYYAKVRKLKVQVVFFTEHLNENYRWHERLDSLWTAGLANYPVVSEFPDAYSTTLSGAWTNFQKSGYTKDTINLWVAYQLCRFRPLVAVTHSYKGEDGGVYAGGAGHGQHMAAADALTSAAELAAASDIGGLEKYDLPKLYIHCYGTGLMKLSCIDEAYPELGGLTPFNVSQNAFLCHESQWSDWSAIKQWMWGTNYPVSKPETITIKKSSDIKVNSPIYYGLARTGAGVPADSLKKDLFENLTPYPQEPEETTAEVTTAEITTEEITTAEVTTPEATTQEQTTEPEITSAEESTPGDTAALQTEPEITTLPEITKTPENGTRTFEELQYANNSRKPFLVILSLITVVALVIVLYIGIQIIRKCKNP